MNNANLPDGCTERDIDALCEDICPICGEYMEDGVCEQCEEDYSTHVDMLIDQDKENRLSGRPF